MHPNCPTHPEKLILVNFTWSVKHTRASVMRQQDSGTPCPTRQGTFQPLEPSNISYQPDVFLKIVFAALVERSYLDASYQNSSSPSC
jgi:hypothetical protein